MCDQQARPQDNFGDIKWEVTISWELRGLRPAFHHENGLAWLLRDRSLIVAGYVYLFVSV